MNGDVFFSARKARRERVLRKMANMRAAKARKRLDTPPEPRMEKWYRFQYGVRDKTTGETHFRDLVSVRQAAKALGLILKHYR
jgi:hypothetical protein